MSVGFDEDGCDDALEHNLKAASPSPDAVPVTVEKAGHNGRCKKRKRPASKRRDRANRQSDQPVQEDATEIHKQDDTPKQSNTDLKLQDPNPKSVFPGQAIKLEPSSDGTVNSTY